MGLNRIFEEMGFWEWFEGRSIQECNHYVRSWDEFTSDFCIFRGKFLISAF